MWLLTISWTNHPDDGLEGTQTYGPYDLETVDKMIDALTERFEGDGAHQNDYGFLAGKVPAPIGPLDIDKLAEELEKVKPGGAERVWPGSAKKT